MLALEKTDSIKEFPLEATAQLFQRVINLDDVRPRESYTLVPRNSNPPLRTSWSVSCTAVCTAA